MASKKSMELRNLAAEELKKAKAITEGKTTLTEAEAKQFRVHQDECDRLMAQADDHARNEAAEEKLKAPATRISAFKNGPEEGDEEEEQPASGGEGAASVKSRRIPSAPKLPKPIFSCMGEQLMAIKNHYTGQGDDERLYKVKASGSNEEVFSEGGALLEASFAYALYSKGYGASDLASRCRKFSVGPNSNGIHIKVVDETSRVTGSRWGGMQGYWVAPSVAATATKPTFGEVDLRLNKMMIVHYATDEELSDIAAMNSLISQAAADEMAYMLNEAIFTGTGVGCPEGIQKSASLVVVAKEAGQVAATVTQPNISKMWSRCWAPGRANAVWLINQDVEPQLDALSLTVGLGGVPVYLPPGGLADVPYGRLKGRPVVIIEPAETCGTQGDITLANFGEYAISDKGDVQSDLSIHVAFLTDESCFRFTFRTTGRSLWKSALTPAKGANTLSPFVTLAVRA
jgi:HK97 family phage major capsid protein